MKTTKRDPKIQLEVVIYDVDLTLSLPRTMSAVSAFNALAHAVEALYAPDGNPVVSLMAEEGVRAVVDALPHVLRQPDNADARGELLYGAWLCGCCLGATTMGLHHKLCHALGGVFDLPHAQTHAILLPYALEYNAREIPDAMEALRRAMRTDDAVRSLLHLELQSGIPLALRDIGMPEAGIARAVEHSMANPYRNPRPVEAYGLQSLLERAWAGSGVQREKSSDGSQGHSVPAEH
jgi:alcohol dehydrogenase class IV